MIRLFFKMIANTTENACITQLNTLMSNLNFFSLGKIMQCWRTFFECYCVAMQRKGRRKKEKERWEEGRKPFLQSQPRQTEALNANIIKPKQKGTYRFHCRICFHALYLSGWALSWTGLTGRSCGLTWPPGPTVSWHALGTSLLHSQYQRLTLHWSSNLCGGAPFPHKMPVLFELLVHKRLTALG